MPNAQARIEAATHWLRWRESQVTETVALSRAQSARRLSTIRSTEVPRCRENPRTRHARPTMVVAYIPAEFVAQSEAAAAAPRRGTPAPLNGRACKERLSHLATNLGDHAAYQIGSSQVQRGCLNGNQTEWPAFPRGCLIGQPT